MTPDELTEVTTSYFDLKKSWAGRWLTCGNVRAPTTTRPGLTREGPRTRCELGKRGYMLRTRAPGVSLWKAVLSEQG